MYARGGIRYAQFGLECMGLTVSSTVSLDMCMDGYTLLYRTYEDGSSRRYFDLWMIFLVWVCMIVHRRINVRSITRFRNGPFANQGQLHCSRYWTVNLKDIYVLYLEESSYVCTSAGQMPATRPQNADRQPTIPCHNKHHLHHTWCNTSQHLKKISKAFPNAAQVIHICTRKEDKK